MYGDLHEVLARPDIDAMLIATGDRWHTMASIIAAKAGKDMYCEKPCSTTIAESVPWPKRSAVTVASIRRARSGATSATSSSPPN